MNESFVRIRPALMADVAARVGVVPYETSAGLHAVLSDAVAVIRGRGLGVAGLLQRTGEPLVSGKPSMWVEDIGGGQAVRLDEPRGPGAIACTFDTDALARAAYMLRMATGTTAEVIFVNRFGGAEAAGGGMRSEIADAVCSGAAVLIPVRVSLLADLATFLGPPGIVLQATAVVIADWAEQVAALRRGRK